AAAATTAFQHRLSEGYLVSGIGYQYVSYNLLRFWSIQVLFGFGTLFGLQSQKNSELPPPAAAAAPTAAAAATTAFQHRLISEGYLVPCTYDTTFNRVRYHTSYKFCLGSVRCSTLVTKKTLNY
ncbi:unnamed protein product, partial [Laminaria digitata]